LGVVPRPLPAAAPVVCRGYLIVVPSNAEARGAAHRSLCIAGT